MATPHRRRSALQELPVVLSPLSVSLLDDSLLNDSNLSRSFASPAPSPDEYIIRQRGRRSISVTWSPPKNGSASSNSNNNNNNNSMKMANQNTPAKLTRSPMKTPTKTNLQMVLRSSPRKRLLMASEGLASLDERRALGPSMTTTTMTSSTLEVVSPNNKLLESTKRLRIAEKSYAQQDTKVPLSVSLRGYSQEQLIDLIMNQMVANNPGLEKKLKEELPVPDIRGLEQTLALLKKNIFRSLPSSRLVKKNDSVAFARASLHLVAFKTAIVDHLAQLHDSKHYDALLDYVLMAWSYVRSTPIWENHSHNAVRRHCFKNLAYHSKSALQHGGIFLGEERLRNFAGRIKDLQSDCDLLASCAAHLDYLVKTIENNDI